MTLTNHPKEVTPYGLYENWGSLGCGDRRPKNSLQVRVRDDLEKPPSPKMLGPISEGGWLNNSNLSNIDRLTDVVEERVGKLGEGPSGVAASPITLMIWWSYGVT